MGLYFVLIDWLGRCTGSGQMKEYFHLTVRGLWRKSDSAPRISMAEKCSN